MKNIHKKNIDISTIINYVIYGIIILVCVFWNVASNIITGLTIDKLLAILVSVLFASEIFLTSEIRKIEKK